MTPPEQTNPNHNYPSDEINLKELWDVLWGGKKLIILITAFFAICSVFYASNLTNYYKSESTLSLSDGTAKLTASDLMGSFSRSIGIDQFQMLPGEQKLNLVIRTIKSRAFLEHLLSFENILPSIMAVKSYDAESKKLILDNEVYDSSTKTWLLKNKPSYLETYPRYLSLISTRTTKSLFLEISIEHVSPIFAKEFLDLIIRETNSLLRQKDMQQSTDALEHLTSQITKTPQVEIKSSINQLIQSQLETQMLAKISNDYVLKTIEPPFIPIKKSKPNKTNIVFLGTTLGGIIGVIWVMMHHFVALARGRREQESEA